MKIDNRILFILLALNLFLAAVLAWTFAFPIKEVLAVKAKGFCSDSDGPIINGVGAIEKYVKGTVLWSPSKDAPIRKYPDHCIIVDNRTEAPGLAEFFCDQGDVNHYDYPCPCFDGACNNIEPS